MLHFGTLDLAKSSVKHASVSTTHTIATLQNLSDDPIPPFPQVWRVTHPPLDMTLSVRWSSVGISGKIMHDRICEPSNISILLSCNRFDLGPQRQARCCSGPACAGG